MIKIHYNVYSSKSQNFRQRFLILHYTAGSFNSSIQELTSGGVSSHYIVPTNKYIDPSYTKNNIEVYSLVPEMNRAWHAGISNWGDRTNLNDSSLGIEIVNLSSQQKFEPYPEEQINILIELCSNILSRYPDIKPNYVLAHSDVAVGRKVDPGPLFPWKTLYQNGIGAWYDEDVVEKYKNIFKDNLPTEQEILDKLYQYGYRYTGSTQILLTAFQMHFRPSNYSGILDTETAAIIYALTDKYFN
ncbi:MAG: N-acetylmuramoyl-L-alanine amidase [Candidatus Brocadiaceae bacterium]|nr:N-acetylmuramoyl-L-alanine amidase [Candidatus Brocadiaceae bacterium]